MDLHSEITKKFDTFSLRQRHGLRQQVDMTADDFIRFIVKHGIVDRVVARKKGLPIKRIDGCKPWSIDNIEVRHRQDAAKAQSERRKRRTKPLARYGGEVLTVAEWIDELREQQESSNA
ncbi:hypothetical protein M2267_001026 [Ensifer sp. KUDG1]|uniref:hypothetical protein n=1 Tax=Ensifer sp. KUDG1 TaxID=3373919 RepID=UPI003D21C0FD